MFLVGYLVVEVVNACLGVLSVDSFWDERLDISGGCGAGGGAEETGRREIDEVGSWCKLP